MVAPLDGMSSFGSTFKLHGINPNERSSHHTEVEVIDHCMGIPALTLQTADVLLELFETRFDLPAGSVVLDDLLK